MPRRTSIISSLLASSGHKGIIDALNKIEQAINATASYLFRDNETPTGAVNGVNKIFTLANNPDPNDSLRLYNNIYQTPVEDYTLSGITITFIEAPLVGSNLRAFYRYK